VILFVLVIDGEYGEKLGEHAVRFIDLDKGIVVAWASMKIWVHSKNIGSYFTCIKNSRVADLEVLMRHDLGKKSLLVKDFNKLSPVNDKINCGHLHTSSWELKVM
jgi:hypothetical protein